MHKNGMGECCGIVVEHPNSKPSGAGFDPTGGTVFFLEQDICTSTSQSTCLKYLECDGSVPTRLKNCLTRTLNLNKNKQNSLP